MRLTAVNGTGDCIKGIGRRRFFEVLFYLYYCAVYIFGVYYKLKDKSLSEIIGFFLFPELDYLDIFCKQKGFTDHVEDIG